MKTNNVENFLAPQVPDTNLSTRESEVAVLIVEGWDDHTIASKLFISVKTVECHNNSIYHKMVKRFDCTGRNKRCYLGALLRKWKEEAK